MSFCVAKEDPNRCTGCEACVQACATQNAIAMEKNKEGFLYPVINNEFCINCGICGKVCPECGEQQFERKPLPNNCIAAIHKDRSVLMNSSSGGAFSALASLMDDRCVIFGAAYGDDLTVNHKSSIKNEGYSIFRKSKYVQSRIGNSFKEVKICLQMGNQVLFTGTPCQIAGLRNFLGKEYDQLICVEIICHGVGSPGVFSDYLTEYGNRVGSSPLSFAFRNKKRILGSWSDFLTTISFKNGKTISTRFDLYTIGFLRRLFLRKSCITCPYANNMRTSDIVIGDFWGIEKNHPELFNKDGVSLVLPITEKGYTLCNRMSSLMSVTLIPTCDALLGNSVLIKPKEEIIERDDFFKIYSEIGSSAALSRFIKAPGYLSRLLAYMPYSIRKILLKFKNKFK